MSLHELKEERERLEEQVSGAEVEMNFAMAEIAMAQAKLTKAKERLKEAKTAMVILDDKIVEMEEARDSVLEDDEVGENEDSITRKRVYPFVRFSGAQPFPAKRPQPFGRGAVCTAPGPPTFCTLCALSMAPYA